MTSAEVHNAISVQLLNHQVAGILGSRQLGRERPRRRTPYGARRMHPERLMRAILVVLLLEPIKALLLQAQALRRRSRRLCLQRPMHPFMPAVLLRLALLDALMDNPKLHPPNRQPRQSRNRRAAERTSVICPDGIRQPHLGKDALAAAFCS